MHAVSEISAKAKPSGDDDLCQFFFWPLPAVVDRAKREVDDPFVVPGRYNVIYENDRDLSWVNDIRALRSRPLFI